MALSEPARRSVVQPSDAAAFEHAPVGIAHIGSDGRMLRVNRKFADILGYETHDLLSMKLQDVGEPRDANGMVWAMARLLEGKRDLHAREMRQLRRDGQELWVRASVSLLPGQ